MEGQRELSGLFQISAASSCGNVNVYMFSKYIYGELESKFQINKINLYLDLQLSHDPSTATSLPPWFHVMMVGIPCSAGLSKTLWDWLHWIWLGEGGAFALCTGADGTWNMHIPWDVLNQVREEFANGKHTISTIWHEMQPLGTHVMPKQWKKWRIVEPMALDVTWNNNVSWKEKEPNNEHSKQIIGRMRNFTNNLVKTWLAIKAYYPHQTTRSILKVFLHCCFELFTY